MFSSCCFSVPFLLEVIQRKGFFSSRQKLARKRRTCNDKKQCLPRSPQCRRSFALSFHWFSLTACCGSDCWRQGFVKTWSIRFYVSNRVGATSCGYCSFCSIDESSTARKNNIKMILYSDSTITRLSKDTGRNWNGPFQTHRCAASRTERPQR